MIACCVCFAPGLRAEPSPEQLDRIAELAGEGKVEEARIRAETLLEVFPDDPNLKRMLAMLPQGGKVSPSSGMDGSRAGEVREFGGIAMVWCPAGSFTMGSPVDEPGRDDSETQHEVKLTRGFWLAKTETTQGQWAGAMGSDVASLKAGGEKDKTLGGVNATGSQVAMYFTSWDGCQKWLAEMNRKHPLPEGWKWSLPTEAQWEYACRAGSAAALPTGAIQIKGENNAPALDGIAWYGGNSSVGYKEDTGYDTKDWTEKQYPGGIAGVREVGLKEPNAWGLHDMIGNVVEWCSDWYGDYPSGSVTDPVGASSGSYRVARGGSWFSNARYCRSAARSGGTPDNRNYNLGFR
ncbi:MAG TPA: formylglycine-generating enzyme family protein, partial [Bacteroidia bacterium]|nr:formylglycine-generating enzyme family protein [Bacteroidia bacterium]